MLDQHDCASKTKNTHPKPGPKTPEGKSRSSMNALRHGLSGRVVVLPSEDLAAYRDFAKEFLDSLQPATPLEREIAQTITDGYWRLKRVRTIEESLLGLSHNEPEGDFDAPNPELHAAFTAAKSFRAHSGAFVNLSMYEQRIARTIEKATKQLNDLQASRKAHREQELTEAILLRDFDKSNDLPFNPPDDGFVYSTAEIDLEAHRRDRRKRAHHHEFQNLYCIKKEEKAA